MSEIALLSWDRDLEVESKPTLHHDLPLRRLDGQRQFEERCTVDRQQRYTQRPPLAHQT